MIRKVLACRLIAMFLLDGVNGPVITEAINGNGVVSGASLAMHVCACGKPAVVAVTQMIPGVFVDLTRSAHLPPFTFTVKGPNQFAGPVTLNVTFVVLVVL